MKTHAKQGGFTLIEIGVVLAIIGVLAAIGVPSVTYMLRRSRVQSVVASLPAWRGFVATLASSSGSSGTIPLTEGAVPWARTALNGGAVPATAATGTRLDMAFVSLGITDKLISFSLGDPNQTPLTGTAEVRWSPAEHGFFVANAATGAISNAAPDRDWTAISRIESRVANLTNVPSAAAGANFMLDGLTPVCRHGTIAYAVLMAVPYKDALELSRELNGQELTQADEAGTIPQNNGPVVFAAPVAGAATVDVYVYICST